jgi:hypothetical protein
MVRHLRAVGVLDHADGVARAGQHLDAAGEEGDDGDGVGDGLVLVVARPAVRPDLHQRPSTSDLH